MQQLITGAFDRFIAVVIFVILQIDIFFFSDEDNGNFFHPVSVGDSIVFLKMATFIYVIQDGGDIVWMG